MYVLRLSPHNEDILPYYARSYEGLKKIAAWYLRELFFDFPEYIDDEYFSFERRPRPDFNDEYIPVLVVQDPVDLDDVHKFYIGEIELMD